MAVLWSSGMSSPATRSETPPPQPPAAADRLRDFITALPQATRDLLARELGKARDRGEDFPGLDLILSAIAPVPAEVLSEEAIRDLVLAPLQPFTIEERLTERQTGMVMGASLPMIWRMLVRDLVPDPARALTAALERSGTDAAAAAEAVSSFQNTAVAALKPLAVAAGAGGRPRELAALADDRAIEDLPDVMAILAMRDQIAAFAARFPLAMRSFGDDQVEHAQAQIDALLRSAPRLVPYALALLHSRMTQPHQILRLAVKAVGSDEPSKLRPSPYGVVVDFVIADLDRTVVRTAHEINRGDLTAACPLVKAFHDIARGLRTELSLGGETAWGKAVAHHRARFADVLTRAIETVPGRVRQTLRSRGRDGTVATALLSPDALSETEGGLDLMNLCRTHAAEIAMNEVSGRLFSELQGFLEKAATQLIETLKLEPEVDRPLKVAQVNAAVRFCAQVYGASYGQLLQKAADVAIMTRPPQR